MNLQSEIPEKSADSAPSPQPSPTPSPQALSSSWLMANDTQPLSLSYNYSPTPVPSSSPAEYMQMNPAPIQSPEMFIQPLPSPTPSPMMVPSPSPSQMPVMEMNIPAPTPSASPIIEMQYTPAPAPSPSASPELTPTPYPSDGFVEISTNADPNERPDIDESEAAIDQKNVPENSPLNAAVRMRIYYNSTTKETQIIGLNAQGTYAFEAYLEGVELRMRDSGVFTGFKDPVRPGGPNNPIATIVELNFNAAANTQTITFRNGGQTLASIVIDVPQGFEVAARNLAPTDAEVLPLLQAINAPASRENKDLAILLRRAIIPINEVTMALAKIFIEHGADVSRENMNVALDLYDYGIKPTDYPVTFVKTIREYRRINAPEPGKLVSTYFLNMMKPFQDGLAGKYLLNYFNCNLFAAAANDIARANGIDIYQLSFIVDLAQTPDQAQGNAPQTTRIAHALNLVRLETSGGRDYFGIYEPIYHQYRRLFSLPVNAGAAAFQTEVEAYIRSDWPEYGALSNLRYDVSARSYLDASNTASFQTTNFGVPYVRNFVINRYNTTLPPRMAQIAVNGIANYEFNGVLGNHSQIPPAVNPNLRQTEGRSPYIAGGTWGDDEDILWPEDNETNMNAVTPVIYMGTDYFAYTDDDWARLKNGISPTAFPSAAPSPSSSPETFVMSYPSAAPSSAPEMFYVTEPTPTPSSSPETFVMSYPMPEMYVLNYSSPTPPTEMLVTSYPSPEPSAETSVSFDPNPAPSAEMFVESYPSPSSSPEMFLSYPNDLTPSPVPSASPITQEDEEYETVGTTYAVTSRVETALDVTVTRSTTAQNSNAQISTYVSMDAEEAPAEKKLLTDEEIKEINEKMEALLHQAVTQTYVTDLWADVVKEFEKGNMADLTSVEGSMAYVQMKIGWIVDYEAELHKLADKLADNLELQMVKVKEDIDRELRRVRGKITKWKILRDEHGNITGVDWDTEFPTLPRNARLKELQIDRENRAMENSKAYIDMALKPLDESIKLQNKMSETLDKIQKAFTDKSEIFFDYMRARYKALTDAMQKSLLCIYDADKCEGENKDEKLEAQKSEKNLLNHNLEMYKKLGDELAKTDAFFFRGPDYSDFVNAPLQTVSTQVSSKSDEAIFPKPKSEYDQKDIDNIKKMIEENKNEYESIQYYMHLFIMLFEFLAGQVRVEV